MLKPGDGQSRCEEEKMPIRFQSPLSNLCEVLHQVKEAAKLYDTTLRASEASTRATLIDPILHALGWDTANPHMVELEKTVGSTRADYVLNDESKKARIIIEAKRLSTSLGLSTTISSLVAYAFTHQLSDVFVTDGLVWHHYCKFDPTNLTPNKILDLAKDRSIDVATYLVEKIDAANYWSVETVDPLSAKVSELEQLVESLKTQIAQKMTVPVAAVTPSVKSTTAKSVPPKPTKVSNVRTEPRSQITSVTGTKPTLLCLPDETQRKVSSWNAVLQECCQYCLQNNSNLTMPFADQSGKSVQLFSFVQVSPKAQRFKVIYQGKTLYVHTNYSADSCVKNAVYALQQVSGTTGGDATVTFSQREKLT